MAENQPPSEMKFIAKASRRGRVISIWILAAGLAICIFLSLWAAGIINFSRFLLPCGMKMRFGIPCPTCGFTTATLAFFRGDIFGAFYIQPAGALLCVALIITVFLTFITAVFGVYFPFLLTFARRLKVWQIIVAVILILGGAWAVTLARALAQKG
ncbi:MAG: DUF2752 domain-containing protein [Phycisphaerae bacterium]|jgi:hypothetical protein